MPSRAKMALATWLVFGTASAALAESNNGANHRGPVVWSRTTDYARSPSTQGRSAGSIVTPGSTSRHRDELEHCSFERSYLKSPRFCVMHTADVSLGVMPRFDSVGNHD
jgi:hypothetical protein